MGEDGNEVRKTGVGVTNLPSLELFPPLQACCNYMVRSALGNVMSACVH
jgi:hypothetical protein